MSRRSFTTKSATATNEFIGWDTKRLLVSDDVWDVLIRAVLFFQGSKEERSASPGAVEGALPSRSGRTARGCSIQVVRKGEEHDVAQA